MEGDLLVCSSAGIKVRNIWNQTFHHVVDHLRRQK
jgi:hypothetical protein